jgi:hypothetical protein
MWEHIKTFIVVAVVTAFVWLAADQNVQEEQSFKIPVRVVTRDPNRYVALVKPPQQALLKVTMSGRRRHLKAFAEAVASQGVFEAVMDDSKVSRREPQPLSTEDELLKRIKAVSESHLVVKAVEPRAVSVMIDEFQEIPDIAVQPNFGDMKVSATCLPSKVAIRLPRFAVGQLPPDRIIRPNAAPLIQEELKSDPEDREFRISLPLTLEMAGSVPIVFVPDKVTISGVVETLQATASKGPVQITFSVPLEVQEKFSIVVEPGTSLRQNINITGPSNLLDRLDPRDIRAFVEVMVADMDEPGRVIMRQVHIILPPGFMVPTNAPPLEVAFRLVPHPAAGPARD